MLRNLLVIGVLSLPASSALAAENLRLTTAAPPKTPWVAHVEETAENLKAASGGEMTIDVFAASQLGTDVETLRQVVRGRIDLGVFSINASASVVPEIALMASPFFWDSEAQADCAIDNHLTAIYAPLFDARGLHILQWHELGWQNVFGKEPLLSPTDMVGVKTRVTPAENHDIFWRNSGANGVPLPFSEIATGLQTGLVDAGELPTIPYVATGVGKLAPHMVETRRIYQPSVMVISKKVWSGLRDKQQEMLMSALADEKTLRMSVRGAAGFFEGKHAESGGTIHKLTPEQRAEWAAVFTPELQQELVQSIGGEAEAVFDAVLAAREACSSS